MLVLDTNVYLDLLDDVERAERLALELDEVEDAVSVSSVVLSELLIGLRHPKDRSEMIGQIVRDGDEIITPTHDDWLRAGDAMRGLGGNAATKGRSLWNDTLIAASCVRVGATLVTSNRGDFRRIGKVIPVRTVPAWWRVP